MPAEAPHCRDRSGPPPAVPRSLANLEYKRPPAIAEADWAALSQPQRRCVAGRVAVGVPPLEALAAARDPAKVCGSIWFDGTDEQRAAFKGGSQGRGRDEKPPKDWWDDCIAKTGAKTGAEASAAAGDLTAEERSCVARKIKLLMEREGKSQQQAIALAVAHCAPGKKRAAEEVAAALAILAAADGATIAPRVERLPAEHRAERAADGTWSIFDVPIYAEETIRGPATTRDGEVRETRSGRVQMRDYVIDRAWLEGAVATAARRRAGGYLPPLHVNHHDQPTRHAGVFAPRRVAYCAFGGRRMWTLFADLFRVPDDVFQEMRAGKLPYRSVEILDIRRSTAEAEVDSVALMADRVPRFRFPNLRIADERRLEAAARPALAHYAAADGSVAVVSCFAEDDMATAAAAIEDKTREPSTRAAEDAAAAKAKCADACRACVEACKACAEAVGGEDAELAALCEACAAKCAECEKACEGHAPEQPGPAEIGPGTESADRPSAAAIRAAADATLRATTAHRADAETARLAARVAALEAQLATQARGLEVAAAVKATADALEGEGFVIERVKLERLARDYGPKGLESFAALLRETPMPGPREGWDTDLARDRRPGEDAPEVAAYASAGPDQLQVARRLAALYASAESAFVRDAGYNLKTYLAVNMGAPSNGTAAKS